MALNLVLVILIELLAIGIVTSKSEICQNLSLKFEYGFEKTEARLNLQCENVEKNSDRGIDFLKYSSIVFGLLESVQNEHVDATCFKDSRRVVDGVRRKETWAIKGELFLIAYMV
jgi:hypothetical protein